MLINIAFVSFTGYTNVWRRNMFLSLPRIGKKKKKELAFEMSFEMCLVQTRNKSFFYNLASVAFTIPWLTNYIRMNS